MGKDRASANTTTLQERFGDVNRRRYLRDASGVTGGVLERRLRDDVKQDLGQSGELPCPQQEYECSASLMIDDHRKYAW